ncbi:unnamed protein product, partial [Candidula unifasciata]
DWSGTNIFHTPDLLAWRMDELKFVGMSYFPEELHGNMEILRITSLQINNKILIQPHDAVFEEDISVFNTFLRDCVSNQCRRVFMPLGRSYFAEKVVHTFWVCAN